MLNKTILLGFGLTVLLAINSCGFARDQTVVEVPVQLEKDSLDTEAIVSEPRLVEDNPSEYIKPGAAVSFAHDYDGSAEPGVRETFTLNVNPSYTSGNLELELSTSDGLDLRVASVQNFEMSGKTIAVPIEIYAELPGEYRLNMIATVGTGAPMSSIRAQSITIYAGSVASALSEKSQVGSSDADAEAVVELRAEETIR